ncbi:hypothetical protein GCM10022254_63470 [Actinomadura meridiana]|uniref:Uncharacterized protein n=1 Tax=Actinomadura meridiana TaxID=559626 RepID=A0ABP8CJD3_9ACTN
MAASYSGQADQSCRPGRATPRALGRAPSPSFGAGESEPVMRIVLSDVTVSDAEMIGRRKGLAYENVPLSGPPRFLRPRQAMRIRGWTPSRAPRAFTPRRTA